MPDQSILSLGPLQYVLMQELWARSRGSAGLAWGHYIRAAVLRLRRSQPH
jgi:hypothetical protein